MCSEATEGILDFCSIQAFFVAVLDKLGLPESWDRLAYVLAGLTLAFVVINALVMATALYTWFERRAIGRFQSRLGPNRWGPFGLLQPLADMVKLITKEDTVPDDADRAAFALAPIVLVVPTLLVVAVIPFGGDSFLGRLNIGILFIVGVTSVNTIAIFMGGWASRNKYAMFGAMRGVAMLISYEVPMALAITGVLLLVGPSIPLDVDPDLRLDEISSLSLLKIVEAQRLPFLLVSPLGFIVFIAAATAEMSRTPFDQIEAESELGAGYHTEYSGMKFGVFQLAEFMAPIVTSIIVVTLFLGGTSGFSPVPGQAWFLVKVFAMVFAFLWVRSTWPRLRVDQIMAFAWKALFAMALVNLFLLAVEVSLLQDSEGRLSVGSLWLMSAINWAITVVTVVAFANLLGQRRMKRPTPVPSPLANMNVEAD